MSEGGENAVLHRIIIEGRRNIKITGVEDVESFDDDCVVVYTVDGTMTVGGAGFHINKLTIENGELEIDGDVDSIRYSDSRREEHGGFFGRIFR